MMEVNDLTLIEITIETNMTEMTEMTEMMEEEDLKR